MPDQPLSIQELINLIIAWINDNKERKIDGVILQERLIDIIRALVNYVDTSMESTAVNYYVDGILWDPAIGALTLVRAGGVFPVNISTDLDGRYLIMGEADYRCDEVEVPAGPFTIDYRKSLPEGSEFCFPVLKAKSEFGTWADFEALNPTLTSFDTDFEEPRLVKYLLNIKR